MIQPGSKIRTIAGRLGIVASVFYPLGGTRVLRVQFEDSPNNFGDIPECVVEQVGDPPPCFKTAPVDHQAYLGKAARDVVTGFAGIVTSVWYDGAAEVIVDITSRRLDAWGQPFPPREFFLARISVDAPQAA